MSGWIIIAVGNFKKILVFVGIEPAQQPDPMRTEDDICRHDVYFNVKGPVMNGIAKDKPVEIAHQQVMKPLETPLVKRHIF